MKQYNSSLRYDNITFYYSYKNSYNSLYAFLNVYRPLFLKEFNAHQFT